MIRGSLVALALVGACQGATPVVVPKPVPPGAPTAVAAGVTVRGPDGQAFLGANVSLEPWDGSGDVPCTWNGVQYACVTTAAGGSTLTILAATFQPIIVDVTIASQLGDFRLAPLPPPHVDPWTLEGLDHPRTDFSGIFIDEIKPQCPEDPVTHIRCTANNGQFVASIAQGLLFTANYAIYTDVQRSIIRDVLTGKRPDKLGLVHHYNAIVVSLFCGNVRDYHDIYPECASHRQIDIDPMIRELSDAGLSVWGVAQGDFEPDDATTTPEFLTRLQNRDLITNLSIAWEHVQVNCAAVKLHQALPKARIWWHNPTDADGPYGDPCFPADPYPGAGTMFAWLRDHAGLVGVLKQTENDLDGTVGRIADLVASFSNGPRECSVGCGWPSGLKVAYFEDANTIYGTFWGGGLLGQAALDYADKVNRYLHAPLCEDVHSRAVIPGGPWCGNIIGYMSGGTVQ